MSAKLGPVAYNAALALLEVEMAAEMGVIREEYADLKGFRAARTAAGLTIEMVRAEKTRRSGKPSVVEARNERLRLQAVAEEEAGLAPYVAGPGEKLTYTQRALNRFREEVRLQLQLQGSSELKAVTAPSGPAAASASAQAPKAPARAPAPNAPAPVAAPVAPARAPVPKTPVAAPAPVAAKPAAPVLSAKETAMLAALKEEYDEVELGGTVYLRHKSLGAIYTKGAGVGELGDEMPEWDEDLGEWKSE